MSLVLCGWCSSHSLSELFNIASPQCAGHTEYTFQKSMTIGGLFVANNAPKQVSQSRNLFAFHYFGFMSDE